MHLLAALTVAAVIAIPVALVFGLMISTPPLRSHGGKF
jgi:hypothetical protein